MNTVFKLLLGASMGLAYITAAGSFFTVAALVTLTVQ